VHGADVPSYDRALVRTGVVHVGVGGFHRSHEAVYLDRLLADGALEWGICGVGTQPSDRPMSAALTAQDGLYTVTEKHPDGSRTSRVIGSIVDYLYAPDDPEAVIERMASPETHVVSLTITEGGYLVEPGTHTFLGESDPLVLLDLAQPGAPTTVFGLVVEALARRRSRGTAPFTVLSCDNMPGNGDVARAAFSAFAQLRDPDLGRWVRESVSFPHSMVDRITPATSEEDRASVSQAIGVADAVPVVCEPFQQWVLEDDFSDGRPPWEDAGVQLVPDVEPYELMKLHLLNAGHQVLGCLGYLAGHRHIDEVSGDPVFAALLADYLEYEASPVLPPVPGIDLADYRRLLLQRFANPWVRDTLARICAQISDRIPIFLLPVIRHQRASGGDFTRSALAVAAWARYAEGIDEAGRPIVVVDRLLETVRDAAASGSDDPAAFLTRTGVFGELADDAVFTDTYVGHLESLHRNGSRATAMAVNALRPRTGGA
jgi:mannitol 2-dehydrogenase